MESTTSVLIVDDEPAVRHLISRWVTSLGHHAVTAANADEALDALQTREWDLAVIDVMMPGRNGLWLACEVHREHPNTAVVLATAHTELLDGGTPETTPVADLLIKPFKRDRFMLALDRGLQWHEQASAEIARHAELSRETAEKLHDVCARLSSARARGFDEIAGLVRLMDERIPDVLAHSERVRRFSLSIARELALPEDVVLTIDATARLHDIGKLAIPSDVLNTAAPLSPGQIAVMRHHVEAGADILASSPALEGLAPFVAATHEWYSGGGYPKKLSGTAIPLPSRIVAVVDAYDAMTHDRQYRSCLGPAEALAELTRSAPAQFDPELVKVFIAILGRQ